MIKDYNNTVNISVKKFRTSERSLKSLKSVGYLISASLQNYCLHVVQLQLVIVGVFFFVCSTASLQELTTDFLAQGSTSRY